MTPTTLRIEGELTIFRAQDCKAALLDALGPGAEVECDLSGVTEFDTAGVQVLLLARREAAARGAVLRLSGHSAAVLSAFELLDLGRHFGDPPVVAAER